MTFDLISESSSFLTVALSAVVIEYTSTEG